VSALLRRAGGRVLSSNPSSLHRGTHQHRNEIGEFIANVAASVKSSKWCAAACSGSRAPTALARRQMNRRAAVRAPQDLVIQDIFASCLK